jgi:hypothetical protein
MEDAWIEFPFEVTGEREPKRLLLGITRSYDFGQYRVLLDGVELESSLDAYSDITEAYEAHLLDFWADPGEHILRMECIGKNPKSTDYWLGLESIRLRERRPRVKEWAHDRDKQWRENPILYR